LLICGVGVAVIVVNYFIKQSPLVAYGKFVKQLQADGFHQNPDGSFTAPTNMLTGEASRAIATLKQRGIPITDESFAAEMARAKSNAQPAAPLTPSASEVIEHEGGFAYTLPPDWILRAVPDTSYKMVFGRESDGNPANISFTVASIDGDLDKCESTLLSQLRAGYPSMGLTDLKVINMSAFETNLQQIGAQVAIQVQRQDGKVLQQFIYIFELKGGTKVFATCTCTADEKDTYHADFNAIMKTFRVTR